MEVEDTPGTEKSPTPPAEEPAPAPVPMQSEEASTSAAPPSEVAVPDDIDSPSAGAPLGADRKLRERTPKAYKGADEPALVRQEIATGLALVNDILSQTLAAWRADPAARAAIPAEVLLGRITFVFSQLHWSRLPLDPAKSAATSEAIRQEITDLILTFPEPDAPAP